MSNPDALDFAAFKAAGGFCHLVAVEPTGIRTYFAADARLLTYDVEQAIRRRVGGPCKVQHLVSEPAGELVIVLEDSEVVA